MDKTNSDKEVNKTSVDKEADKMPIDGPSDSKKFKSTDNVTHSMQPQITGPGSIRYPTCLPSITPDLQKKVNDLGILRCQKDFIAFWAGHLCIMTNQRPSRLDYQNYAQSIVAAYPALADANGGCVSIFFPINTFSVWLEKTVLRILNLKCFILYLIYASLLYVDHR